MKSKIFNRLNLYKWLAKLDIPARAFIWPFVMILAILTVVLNISIFNEPTRLILLIYLILFFIATSIVFLNEVLRNQIKTSVQETGSSVNIEHAGRYRWISIGLLLLVVIVIGLIFVARQLPPTTQGYQTFFIAFAGIGAWVTGIALAVFAYQQYKLRQTEHSLLFNPQLLLSSSAPIIGEAVYNRRDYPYRIEWSMLIQNTSSVPIIIGHMAIKVKSARGDLGREEYIPYDCYFILEPDGLEPPFQVTIAAPQRVKYVIAGRDMAQVLDYVSGNSKSRVFELIFKVRATIPQGQSAPTIMETASIPFIVPEKAKWGNSTPALP